MDEYACTLQDFRRLNCWSDKDNVKELFFVAFPVEEDDKGGACRISDQVYPLERAADDSGGQPRALQAKQLHDVKVLQYFDQVGKE